MKYVISYDIDMPTLLSAAELIITDFSNVGIEAILLDRPLLTVNFSNESFEYVLRYHEYGSSLYIEKYQDLEKITKEIIIEKKYLRELSNGRKKIIELINYKNDGKAGERIFNSLNH
jgi:CDP-glycerol glycerophosphotransferase (TagB/SpsB family)